MHVAWGYLYVIAKLRNLNAFFCKQFVLYQMSLQRLTVLYNIARVIAVQALAFDVMNMASKKAGNVNETKLSYHVPLLTKLALCWYIHYWILHLRAPEA